MHWGHDVISHLVALPEVRLARPAISTPSDWGRSRRMSGRGDAVPRRFTDKRMGVVTVLVYPETCKRLGRHGDTVAFAVVWVKPMKSRKETFIHAKCFYVSRNFPNDAIDRSRTSFEVLNLFSEI